MVVKNDDDFTCSPACLPALVSSHVAVVFRLWTMDEAMCYLAVTACNILPFDSLHLVSLVFLLVCLFVCSSFLHRFFWVFFRVSSCSWSVIGLAIGLVSQVVLHLVLQLVCNWSYLAIGLVLSCRLVSFCSWGAFCYNLLLESIPYLTLPYLLLPTSYLSCQTARLPDCYCCDSAQCE